MPNHAGALQGRFFPAKLETEGDDAIFNTLLNVGRRHRNVMNKNIVVPTALFFLSALLTVMLHPAVLFLAGSVICVIAVLKYRSRKDTELKLGATMLFRSGIAVIAGAIVTVASVLAAMSGLFAR